MNVACIISSNCTFSSFKCLSAKEFWDSRLCDLMTHLITLKRLYFSSLFVVLFILLDVLYFVYSKTGNDHFSFTFYTIHNYVIPRLSHLFGSRRTLFCAPPCTKPSCTSNHHSLVFSSSTRLLLCMHNRMNQWFL